MPCSWHCTCAAAGEAESEEVVVVMVVVAGGSASVKAAEREALVALERLVKAMDASGPASVRMCYDCDKRLCVGAT